MCFHAFLLFVYMMMMLRSLKVSVLLNVYFMLVDI